MGKILIYIGVLVLFVGVILELWTRIGGPAPGQLPGDLSVQRENFSFHFPIVTCIVVSIILSGLMWLVRRFY
jgi:hypothetical protein